MSMQWFILKVGTNREETVRRRLLTRVEALGLGEVVRSLLVASQRRTEIKAGQRRTVEKRLYPGYVMVQIRTNDDGSIPAEVLHLVRETPGPINFVGTAEQRDRPEPMSPDEVAKLMRQLKACSADDAPVSVEFDKGERVRVKEGAFAGSRGRSIR